MGLPKKNDHKYTYDEYLSWPENERWEIIDGDLYCMTPAPGLKHQRITGLFFNQLTNKLAGKPCSPWISPVDVVLSEHDVVQPDISVVCDKNKITDANIQGPPDLVIEVLSPSTALKDKRGKKNLYERYGVKEYIIIDILDGYVERYILNNNRYDVPEIFGTQDVLKLYSLEGIEVSLWEIFEVERKENQDV